jgi:sec-independent protein translocase protein TatC
MTKTQPTPTSPSAPAESTQQTLIDHLHELRARLFWIVLSLILASSASYLIQDQIMAVLMHPLGGQRLVYLTPIGGFNFIFKVSLYFGIGLILPVIIYHLYRFLEPLMEKRRKRSVILYILASTLLAIGGACFAYFGSLPAALHFLTGFDIQNVTAMLTVDSYLAFIITYVLGFAALFQIPLILMIINTIKPLPPKKLMGFQRFVVLAAFILAAIISPTPDITNQAILAVPIILMYQIGVMLVWLQSRTRRPQKAEAAPLYTAPEPQTEQRPTAIQPQAAIQQPTTAPRPTRPVRPVMDIATPRRMARPAQSQASRPVPIIRDIQRPVAARPAQRPATRPNTMDGMVPRRQQMPQAS